jgi:hypothetical protein
MSVRDDIEKRIVKEKQKISDLQKQIERSNAFVQGMQEALKLLSGNSKGIEPAKEISYFRSGDTKSAYETLKQTGSPMHIDELLSAIGKPISKQNRASLASSLHRAAKRSGIVKSIGNNTFSLSEISTNGRTNESVDKEVLLKLPDNFGEDIKPKDNDDIPF